ncbi:hypothetical protein MWU75_17365 [Ornithinimicrobium sp. F0845]|uniref:hypothetical protein n=1 Tax=Ornithinimicrobium sp. F0845 TaxID=2926412 RepID=UPI001FF1077B|nr:hypothetical protein [Ornithinimicrobium sp. F0845]MCK0113916.1 hypothetical protein [Ornithinimicrobium sp. F0845]
MLEWGAKKGGVVPILLDGEQVATVDPEFWREGAELVIADQTWRFERDGRDRIARLARNPKVALRATKPKVWRDGWVVTGEGVTYDIGSEGFFGRTQRVLRDGRRVGTAHTAGAWSSRPVLDVDPSVPPAHQLFLLWISHIIRKRNAAAGAAG